MASEWKAVGAMDDSSGELVLTGEEAGERQTGTTPLQAGMLFHAAAHPGSGVDVEQISMRLDEPLDLERFTAAWQKVFERHPILRSRFDWQSGSEPLMIQCEAADVSVAVADWSDVESATQEQRIAELMTADRVAGFDLAAGPVNRFNVAQLGAAKWWILWSFHHSILDGRSFPIVLNEVFQLYDNGLETPLPDRRPFDEYVQAIVRQDLKTARNYWSEKLASFESASTVPSTIEPSGRNDAGKDAGPSVNFVQVELDEADTRRLRALADQTNSTLNTCVQAAWYLTLAHYSTQPVVTFGTTRACRHAAEGSADMVGLLINTVPMALPVDRTETVTDLLGRMRSEQIDLRAHEIAPLGLIAECGGVTAAELFHSIVVFDDASLDTRMGNAFPDHAETRHFRYDGQTNYPLTLLVYGDPAMTVRLEYAVDAYDEAAAQQVLEHYLNLIKGMAAHPDKVAVKLPYLTPAEHRRYSQWNSTDRPYELETTLQAMFERQAAATPEAVALVLGDQSMTYDEFNRRSNQLAHHLQANGVGADSTVGLYAERSMEMMIAIYGIIKAGGAYVPLDPDHPADRIQFMAEDSGVDMVLTQSALVNSLPDTNASHLVLDVDDGPWTEQPDHNPHPVAGPDHMAYLLYTSGSTGRPKGVMVEHRAIVNRLIWMQEAYGLGAADSVLQKTPYTFDVSVWELFWPMQVGARLVLAKPGGHRDAAYLVDVIEQNDISTLHFVPSMLQLFVEEPTVGRCSSIRRVICSGEALPRSLQDRLFEVLNTELHNLYGPTEAAVDVTWWACDPQSPLDTVPIGYPIANTQVHILDADLQRVPLGVPGELHIGGVQLARGYRNRPELTAEKFIADPWSDATGDRLYKTGDLVRHRFDGAVEFLGRLDHQIKIRGQRVELGEIEARITDHPSIREVVVVASGSSAATTQLVAYVVGDMESFGDEGAARQAIEDHCGVTLPPYMVPTVWMFLPALPLNSNGKVDRKALPKPDDMTTRDVVAAGSTAEADILGIWRSLLDQENVGVTDAFFDVGGNSLLLVRLAQLLSERYEREIKVPDLLRCSTVRQQADLVQETDDGTDGSVAAGVAMAAARRNRRGARRNPRSPRS